MIAIVYFRWDRFMYACETAKWKGEAFPFDHDCDIWVMTGQQSISLLSGNLGLVEFPPYSCKRRFGKWQKRYYIPFASNGQESDWYAIITSPISWILLTISLQYQGTRGCLIYLFIITFFTYYTCMHSIFLCWLNHHSVFVSTPPFSPSSTS